MAAELARLVAGELSVFNVEDDEMTQHVTPGCTAIRILSTGWPVPWRGRRVRPGPRHSCDPRRVPLGEAAVEDGRPELCRLERELNNVAVPRRGSHQRHRFGMTREQQHLLVLGQLGQCPACLSCPIGIEVD